MKAKKIQKIKRAKNPWLDHLMKEKAKHKEMKFKDVMVLAKGSYKKIK